MASAAVNAERQAVSATAAELAARLLATENLSLADVSVILGVSRWELNQWRLRRQGPPFTRLKRGIIVYPCGLFQFYLQKGAKAHGKRGHDSSRDRHF